MARSIACGVRRVLLGAALVAAPACQRNLSTSELKTGGGTIVDHGGNELTCAHDPLGPEPGKPSFEGNYTLDYVLSYDPRFPADDYAAPDLDAEIARIRTFLAAKLPKALPSFNDYVSLLENPDVSKPRIFIAEAMGLTSVDNGDLIESLPRNCLRKDATTSTDVPNLRQLVRRREIIQNDSRYIHYYYDYDRWTEMKTAPDKEQFSYLLVHEWLWDFTDNPWINRTINHLIHSKRANDLTADQFDAYLHGLGIDIDGANVVGPIGPAENAVRATFEQRTDLCDFSQRVPIELSATMPRFVLAPGQEKTLDVRVPDDDSLDQLGKAICGFALSVAYRSTGSSNVTVDWSIVRGVGLHPVPPLTARPVDSPDQTAHYGLCKDLGCWDREGELAEFLTYKVTRGSHWIVTFKVAPTEHDSVEITSPYLLFVHMKDQ